VSRLVIISDLHLGRPRGAAIGADALRPVWAGASGLVVNGDTAEIHHPRHRAAAARETLRLADFCAADGVDLTLLSGNHDPYLTDRRHLLLADGRVFVTHGDVLHPAVSPWSPASPRVRAANRVALAALGAAGREDLEARLSASQYASFAEWADVAALERDASHSSFLGMFLRPWAILKVLHYWHVVPRLAAEFMKQHVPAATFGIIGHTHHPGTWRVDGRVIINTGSFGFPGKPYAVVLEGDVLEIVAIRRRGDVYEMAPAATKRFELPLATDRAA
jgi:predicted phosphodiesterase